MTIEDKATKASDSNEEAPNESADQDNNAQSSGLFNLRQKAETLANKNSNTLNVNNLTIDAINQLLHELQVHQIELEMQNEQLRESHILIDIARSRYFDLYDLAPVGYLTLNARGLIQKANLTAATLLGMTRNILIKQPISNLILRDDEDIYYLHHKKLMESNEPQSFDLRLVKKDLTAFWANMAITLGTDNEKGNNDTVELRLIISDISARKHAEQALEVAKRIAEEANSAKSLFLSSMSHELRTPLNAILGFAQLIEASEPQLSFNQKRNTEQIVKAGWYLLTLINEILDLAVIEAGQIALTIETLSLADVLSDACAMLENQAQKSGVVINYAPENFLYLVDADQIRLKQVFVNLLSNAIKYNKPDGSITLSCNKTAAQRIRINIQDTGIGMTIDELAQLFQPFNRLGKQFSKIEGTGIGLVVCKRIVELMNGAIGVESTIDKGSLFWIELNLTTPN